MSGPWTESAGVGEVQWPLAAAMRQLLASSLSTASLALGRLAMRLERPAASTESRLQQTEFHCEARASDGSLYIDGRLVGRLRGVRRL